jgi:hypothetical protein
MRFAAPACLTNLPSPATCNYLFKCPLRVIHDRDEPAAGRAPSAMPRKRPRTVSGPRVVMGHIRTHAPQQTAPLFDHLVSTSSPSSP